MFIFFYIDFKYLSRAVRGLVALGEYAFREFIPFIYKFNVDDVPESFWNDFSVKIYLNFVFFFCT